MLNGGVWQPTYTPSKESYFSYHIPSLYAPIGMFDWLHCVRDYVECNPTDQPRKEGAHKVFVNTVLGETYEASGVETTANSIQRNKRNYKIGTIPEQLSLSDGNGKIILLTCAADMNGTVDDARLDWEIVAWAASGASYSIAHGSIGTFIPREGTDKLRADRDKFSYRFEATNNVWDVFTKIIKKDYLTDTGRTMGIYQTGLDCGYFSTNYAYPFVDKSNPLPYIYVLGLKGKGEEDYIRHDRDLKYFTPAKERPNLYVLTVGKIKDELAEAMQLTWNEKTDREQPYGFMNFPNSEGGLYEFTNYFEHFQSEHCVIEANKEGTGTSSRWQKKSGTVMNHMWDVRVYNMAVKEIIVDTFRKELKLPKMTWKEFVIAVTGSK
jgi:phage terminase large subunit GpA-like protein